MARIFQNTLQNIHPNTIYGFLTYQPTNILEARGRRCDIQSEHFQESTVLEIMPLDDAVGGDAARAGQRRDGKPDLFAVLGIGHLLGSSRLAGTGGDQQGASSNEQKRTNE